MVVSGPKRLRIGVRMDRQARPRQTLDEALAEFYEDQRYKGNSAATLYFYRSNLDRFQRGTGIVYLDDFQESAVRRWLLQHTNVSQSTLATYDRSIRVVSKWLHNRGYLPVDPMDRLPKPKARTTPMATFSEADVRTMVGLARASRQPLRDVALITLLLDTGLRIGEAMSLQLRDVDWVQGWLSVEGKTGQRVVPFGRKCRLALRRYVDRGRRAASPGVQHVFIAKGGVPMSVSAATHHVVKFARAAGSRATKVGPHTFRHTFAVEYIRAGGDAFTLQRILGHTTLDMTRRYVHLANEDIRSAHARYAPAERFLG